MSFTACLPAEMAGRARQETYAAALMPNRDKKAEMSKKEHDPG
jgi:hypothetical protein